MTLNKAKGRRQSRHKARGKRYVATAPRNKGSKSGRQFKTVKGESMAPRNNWHVNLKGQIIKMWPSESDMRFHIFCPFRKGPMRKYLAR